VCVEWSTLFLFVHFVVDCRNHTAVMVLPYDTTSYCGMMAALDEGIGNLTATYKSLGIWDDTLLVLAADNGWVSEWLTD
jgi:hypothetical protein